MKKEFYDALIQQTEEYTVFREILQVYIEFAGAL